MIEVALRGEILNILLQREAVRNALDLATTDELLDALERAQRDSSVGAILLHGRGAGFCAGSDLKEMAAASLERRMQIAERKALLMHRLATIDRPVVCAVHGFALGGGFMLATGCDAVVTAEDAQWRLPEVGLGFLPSWGIEALVRRRQGASRCETVTDHGCRRIRWSRGFARGWTVCVNDSGVTD